MEQYVCETFESSSGTIWSLERTKYHKFKTTKPQNHKITKVTLKITLKLLFLKEHKTFENI